MNAEQILDLAVNALENIKGQDITTIKVDHLTDMMTYIVICTATSNTHCASLSRSVEADAKAKQVDILGIEGRGKSDWVLVDLGDVVVHIMLEATREFYALEKLWKIDAKTTSK